MPSGFDFEGFVMGRSLNNDPEKIVPKFVRVRHYDGYDDVKVAIAWDLKERALAALNLSPQGGLDLAEEIAMASWAAKSDIEARAKAGGIEMAEFEVVEFGSVDPQRASAYWRG